MLKLEKASRDGQISIIIRDKERFFSRPIAVAFALAILYHLLFLIIFQVAPFKLRLNQTIFPPVLVEADSIKETAIEVNVDRPKTIYSGLPPRPSSQPSLPDYPYFTAERPVEYIKENSSQINSFLRIEKEVYEPLFFPIEKSPLPPIHIVISGFLADKKLLSEGLKGKKLPAVKSTITQTELRNTYAVLVEGRTGRIFWYEPKQQTSITAIDSFAESILHDVQFTPSDEAFVTAGEIELHFNVGIP